MLHELASALGSWISEIDAWPDDVAPSRRRDPQQQFRVLLDGWHRVVRDHLGQAEKTYVFELKDVRNRWAHHDVFTDDDVWRALDTAERLLRAVGANEPASRVAASKGPTVDAGGDAVFSARVHRSRTDAGRKVAASASEQSVNDLDPATVSAARRAVERLVERSGGPGGHAAVPADYVDSIADLFEAWARHHGRMAPAGAIDFGPQPGLWHALQGLVPIDDPNRWDGLRKAVIKHLESQRGWTRPSPKSSQFSLPSKR